VASLTGGQNLNFAIPASYLAGLLKDVNVGIRKPLSAFTEGPDDLHGANWGPPQADAVVATHVSWYPYVSRMDSLFRNQLDTPIRALYCLVVFRDGSGDSVDTKFLTLSQTIPARLAKRFGNFSAGPLPGGLEPTIEVACLISRIGE